MWICPQCHAENREANVACDSCGAPRSAGRFGSAPSRRPSSVQAPLVSSAPSRQARDKRGQEPPVSVSRSQYQAPEMDVRARKERRPMAVLATVVGIILCVLLPLLAGLIAWRKYDVLQPVVTSLFLLEDAPSWVGLASYIAFAVIAGLVALLPGLWTVLLARNARERR